MPRGQSAAPCTKLEIDARKNGKLEEDRQGLRKTFSALSESQKKKNKEKIFMGLSVPLRQVQSPLFLILSSAARRNAVRAGLHNWCYYGRFSGFLEHVGALDV